MKKILLFLIYLSINYFAHSQVEVVQNGDFAEPCCVGIAWTSYPDMYYNISYSNWNSDPGYAYMATSGGNSGNNLDGEIEQTLANVPSTITSGVFSFWYSITTTETTTTAEYDYVNAYIEIDGVNTLLSRVTNLNNTNGNYVQRTLNLPSTLISYINNGSNFRLRFVGHTDGGSSSTFRIDDVSLILNTPSSSNFDLFITNEQVNSSPFQVGDVMEILCTQNFSGSCGCDQLDPRPRVGFFLSTDQIYDSNLDVLIGTKSSTIGDNDSDDDESINWTIPPDISSGNYYILFVADVEQQHSETNENNTVSIPITIDNGNTNCNGVSIIQQPSNQTASVGSNSTFSVTVTGTAPINYQWKKNGANISNATSQQYTTPTLSISDNGNNYSCEITNCDGTVISNNAILTVSTSQTPSSFIVSTSVLNNSNIDLSSPLYLWNGTTGQSVNPIKICADGSKSTQIEFVNNSSIQLNNIRFRINNDPNQTDIILKGYFDETDYSYPSNGSGNTVIVKYTHPEYVDVESLFRTDYIEVYDITNPTAPPILTIPIHIYRAPVIMVHGLWGDSDSFELLNPFLRNNFYTEPLTHVVDYRFTNDRSFYTNRLIVPANINVLLMKARLGSFSVGKVDVIAHSMGGLLSRYYLQSNDYRNDFHKLITLNSPHFGSQFGNLLDNQGIAGAIFRSVGEEAANFLFNGSISDGAVKDLAVGSQALSILNSDEINNNIVPSHTITTRFLGNDSYYRIIYLTIAPTLGLTAELFINNLFDYSPNDLVVSVPSQTGGLTNNATSTPVYNNIFHNNSPDTGIIQNKIIELLDSNPTSSAFSSNGFVPIPITSNYRPNVENFNNTIIENSVSIVSPQMNDFYNPGETISVNVSSINNVNGLNFFGIQNNNDFSSQSIDIGSHTFSYTIPSDAYGKIQLLVTGYNQNDFIDHDIVTININNNSPIESISFENNTLFIQKDYVSSVPIKINYSNGISHHITNYDQVLYSVQDINIAEYYAENLIKGNLVGNTNLTVTYQGISINIPVVVFENDDYINEIPNLLSVLENELKNEKHLLSIYPNPNNGEFNIQLDSNFSRDVKIIVYNSQGQQVLEKDNQILNNDYSKNISLKELSSGLYYVKILDGKKYRVGKLIIK